MRIIAVIIIFLLGGLGLGSTIEAASHYLTPSHIQRGGLVAIPPKLNAAMPTNLLPTSDSAYAVDLASGTPLYAQNISTPRPIASITKIMTLYLVLSHHKTNELVTVKGLPSYDPEDETLGLVDGQQFKLIDLARAALIPSDNDAADALAIYDAGSTAAFITKMNATLTQWGITGAHYNSASGLEDTDNYASALALAQIAQLAITNPTLKELVNTSSATISDSNGTTYYLKSTNDLLANGQFYGIKTGYTAAAGQCFVGLTTIKGHEVMTIVLGSADRFGDTLALRNWIEGAWTWQ